VARDILKITLFLKFCFIISAKKVMYYPEFVCLSACLLLATPLKNHWSDLHKKFNQYLFNSWTRKND